MQIIEITGGSRQWLTSSLRERIEDAGELSARERYVLLQEIEGRSYGIIGRALMVSRQRAQQIAKKARRKLGIIESIARTQGAEAAPRGATIGREESARAARERQALIDEEIDFRIDEAAWLAAA
jgi:hypothetical protein